MVKLSANKVSFLAVIPVKAIQNIIIGVTYKKYVKASYYKRKLV